MEKELGKFLDLKIDAKSALPVYEQVKRTIKLRILSGHLNEGDQLISIRELSQKLKINPNTILKAYYQLEVEGFIVSRPGSGYFVKIDYRKTQKEKKEIFEELTNEYAFQALELGYSVDEMLNEICKICRKQFSSINSGEQENA